MKNLILITFSVLYLTALYYLQSIEQLPLWFLLFFIVCNVLSFIFYGMDKLAAVKNWQRTRERHFYILALCGGWPGSVLGQLVFHHKTSKVSFRRWFYFMTSINLLLMGWYLNHYLFHLLS